MSKKTTKKPPALTAVSVDKSPPSPAINQDEAELPALFRQMNPDSKPGLLRYLRHHVRERVVRPALRLVQGGATS